MKSSSYQNFGLINKFEKNWIINWLLLMLNNIQIKYDFPFVKIKTFPWLISCDFFPVII